MGSQVRSAGIYGVLTVGLFLCACWPPASYLFDSDDVMNLSEAYVAGPGVLLRAVAFPFTTFNRPAGALYYRLCFGIFGWNPPAFRTVTYLVMIANLALIALLARRLAGSTEIGAAAALLYSFHGRLGSIYSSNGTIYDILCAFFTLLTLWYYVRVRQENLGWSWWRIAMLSGLYIAALNSKEMAAVVPVLMLIFEWGFRSSSAPPGPCGCTSGTYGSPPHWLS